MVINIRFLIYITLILIYLLAFLDCLTYLYVFDNM